MHPCCLTPSPSKTFRIKSFFTFQIASDFECLYRLNWLDLSNSINPTCCKNLKLGYCISSFFFDQKHDPKFSPSPCKSSSKPLGQTADLCRVACSVAMSSRWNSAQGSGMCLAFSIACFQASCRRQRERQAQAKGSQLPLPQLCPLGRTTASKRKDSHPLPYQEQSRRGPVCSHRLSLWTEVADMLITQFFPCCQNVECENKIFFFFEG